jgi:hypothetical protein
MQDGAWWHGYSRLPVGPLFTPDVVHHGFALAGHVRRACVPPEHLLTQGVRISALAERPTEALRMRKACSSGASSLTVMVISKAPGKK